MLQARLATLAALLPSVYQPLASLWFSYANRRWLTGFTGSSGTVLIADSEVILFTDGRYDIQAREEVFEGVVVEIVRSQPHGAASWLQAHKKNALFEQSALSYGAWLQWQQALTPSLLVPVGDCSEQLRRAKDEQELIHLQKAAEIADAALLEILGNWSQMTTEDSVRRALEASCYKRGSRAVPFEFIVAQGVRSALPHGVASQDVLTGEPLTIDWGAESGGYFSDQTVTVVPKRHLWTAKWADRYAAVYASQQAAIQSLRSGVTCAFVDNVARSCLAQEGLDSLFVHGTGHGVGLEIHEAPRLGTTSHETLAIGDVVTVEPGVYELGWGGIRLEDTLIVTADGSTRLTAIDKQAPIIIEG